MSDPSESRSPVPVRGLLNVLKVLFGGGLLAYLFVNTPVGDLLDILLEADSVWLLAGLVLSFLTMAVSIVKLHWLLSGESNVTLARAGRAYYVGTFFNNFIPTSIGGDIVKVYELNRGSDTDVLRGSTAVFLERVSGILVLGLLASFVVLIQPELFRRMGVGLLTDGRIWLLAVVVGGGLLLGINYLSPNDTHDESTGLRELLAGLTRPLEEPVLGAGIVLLSLVFHFVRALNFLVMAQAIGLSIGLLEALSLLPVIAFITFLPVSFGGIGIREGVVTFCLQGLGYSVGSAFAIALIFRGYTVVHSLIGGGLYLERGRK